MSDYELMPVEATPEMEQAAEKYWYERKFKALSDDPRTWKGVYAAMRSAAPAVQGEPESDEGFDEALTEAVSAVSEGGNLLVFLSDHLTGRMGEGALADMQRVGEDLLMAAELFEFAAAAQPEQPSSGVVPNMASAIVNDCCWTFVEAMPHNLPEPIFNDLKPALYEALKQYHGSMLTASKGVSDVM